MEVDEKTEASKVQYLVGVDGGGTKTKALIGCVTDGRLLILGAGQGGPSNPRAVGFEQAFQSINQAVLAAFESAGITEQTCSRAVLCLAGAGREQERTTVESWAKQIGLANQVRLVSEAEATLAAVELDPVGLDHVQWNRIAQVALICGTGSLAWGRLVDANITARAGGWGYLLGDEGSGFWIGQKLLQLACRIADRRTRNDRVLQAVLTELKLSQPNELVQWCYGNAGGRERIAALAPVAFELEEVVDLAQIIDRGASELARMIAAVTEQLGSSQFALAVAGSVVVHQPGYLEKIIESLNDMHLTPVSYTVVAEPVRGALRLASL